MKFAASCLTYVVRAAAFAVVLTIAPSVHAASQYWDANGSAAGLGGTGNWSVTTGGTGNWNDSTGTGPQQDWVDGSDAVFNGTATYTTTISPPTQVFNANSLAFGVTAGNAILTGGTINIASPTNSIVMNTNTSGTARTQIIRSAIGGTDLTVVANAAAGNVNSFLTIGANPTGATNTFTGDLIFGGTISGGGTGFSEIAIDNPTALPATATVRM